MKEDTVLPSRNDTIYQEIESFKDYEYTNCIAYEMAVRDTNFINTIIQQVDELNNDFLRRKKNNQRLDLSYFELYLSCILREFGIPERKLYEIKKIKQLYKMEMIQCLFDNYDCVRTTMDNPFKTIRDGYFIEQYGGIENYEDGSPFGYVISPDFSRPYFKSKKSINVEFEFNLSLPKDELIAYISKIKDEYDKDNSIIKSPLEILGGITKKADKYKISKKLIADKFFVYDYIKAREKQIKETEEYYKSQYEDEKEFIENDKYLTAKEKRLQLKELEKEYKQNADSRITDIFKEFKDIKNFNRPEKTVQRYYYEIKPFIDELKYKELITGIKL